MRFFLVAIYFISCSSYISINAQIPSDDLLLQYLFNNDALDLSGNGLDGIVDGAEIVDDRFSNENSAYLFDGIDDVIEIPSSSDLRPNFPITVSGWFKINQFSTVNFRIFSSELVENRYSGFWISCDKDGFLSAGYGNGQQGLGAENRVTKEGLIEVMANDWHFVVAVFNGLNDIDLYVNCEEDEGYYTGSGAEMGYLESNIGVIGKGHNAASYFDGVIDDLRVYNKALDTIELSYLCYETPCGANAQYLDTITTTINDTITTIINDTIEITIYDSVSVTDTLIIDLNIVGLPAPNNINTIKIFPNPTQDLLIIRTADISVMNNYSLNIISATGSVIYESSFNQLEMQVNLGDFTSSGLYFIQIFNEVNELVDVRKLILN